MDMTRAVVGLCLRTPVKRRMRDEHRNMALLPWYGPRDTYVMLAETNELLEAKVREAIADGWYPEDDGPMPEDFGDLIEKYREVSGDTCYFGDWGYTVIDSTLCTRVEDEQ
jgi:alpha-L-fucosidase